MVQHLVFCRLALETKVLLRFSPQFLQKTPWNLVFLADKPLELVFSLDYAFNSVLSVLYVHAIVVTRRIGLD